MIRATAIGLICMVGLASGCGGGSSSPTTTAGATGSQTAPSGNTIVMGDYSYAPMVLTVPRGTPIVFRNDGKIEHTVADVDAAGEIRSSVIKPKPLATGDTQTVTIDAPGTYDYICTFHPTLMRGTIVVK